MSIKKCLKSIKTMSDYCSQNLFKEYIVEGSGLLHKDSLVKSKEINMSFERDMKLHHQQTLKINAEEMISVSELVDKVKDRLHYVGQTMASVYEFSYSSVKPDNKDVSYKEISSSFSEHAIKLATTIIREGGPQDDLDSFEDDCLVIESLANFVRSKNHLYLAEDQQEYNQPCDSGHAF